MKKTILATITTACALILGVTLFGCANDDRGEQTGGIANGYSIVYAFTVDEGKKTENHKTMLDYMNLLKADGSLTFEGDDGQYGFFITSVMGVGSKTVSSTANSYSGRDWLVYTTVTTVDGVTYSDDGTSLSYSGVTFYKASYGVSGLPCIAGESYALVYEYSSMSW